jgi:hypothetical protein
MRKLSVLPVVLLPGLLLGQVPGPGGIETTYANRREFRIPFNPGPNAQNLKQLQLFVSADQGRTWVQSSTVAPDQQKFQFTADRDGVFWFAVQTVDLQGKAYPPSMEGAQPSLKVIVDTQPPVVQLQPLPPRTGEVGVTWTIRDDHFDPGVPDAVRLEYRLTGGVTWQPLPVAPGAVQFFWNPKANTLVEVRLRARDRAGNVGEATTTVSLSGAGQNYPPTGTDPVAPQAQPSPTLESDLIKLGAGERRFVNSKRIVLSCELKDFGPSGVSLVELWYTHDTRSWSKGPEYRLTPGDEQAKQTMTFEVVSEGVYGITLLARSGVGLGDRPPQIGDRPQLWIEVDTTRPTVKLGGVVVGTGADKGKLSISWSAHDKNLRADPITLSFAEKADGTWKTFAEKLPNNGRYVWTMPTDGVPYQFHVKVEAVDQAGNVGEAITNDLVKVDLANPKVKILNVESGTK